MGRAMGREWEMPYGAGKSRTSQFEKADPAPWNAFFASVQIFFGAPGTVPKPKSWAGCLGIFGAGNPGRSARGRGSRRRGILLDSIGYHRIPSCVDHAWIMRGSCMDHARIMRGSCADHAGERGERLGVGLGNAVRRRELSGITI